MNTRTTLQILAVAAIALTLIFATRYAVRQLFKLTAPIEIPDHPRLRQPPQPQPPQTAPPTIRRQLVPRRENTRRTSINDTDQSRAEAEVTHMAANLIKDHVGTTIGDFEGVGWTSGGEQPPTCEPPIPAVLTADATARGSDGNYRVRAWRWE